MSGWHRSSAQARGYGSAWNRLRMQVLKRDEYTCQCDECKRLGRVRVATEVDHIKPKAHGGTDDLSNLQAINSECHMRKTQAEIGNSVKARIGVDGWPIDED